MRRWLGHWPAVARLPIRVRVAAAFAVAMALVLTATGLFLYLSLGADMSDALDQDLRIRAQDLDQVVSEPGGSLAAASHGRLIERGESFAQLLDPHATVLDRTSPLGRVPLLTAAETTRAMRGPELFYRSSVPGLDEPSRLLATPVTHRGQLDVLVVGATRENRAEALRSLRTKLLLIGPIALVLATGLGYWLAGTGLRAVEAMRRRAAEISGDEPGARLPVQHTRDELERLGTTLNGMLARLDDALERERGFVADAGHELRTPLALLRAELDFALHDASTEAELRDALRVASDETDRLTLLAGDLLLIAGSERGKLPLRREVVMVRDLLDSVRNRFAWRAADAGRDISVEVAGDLSVEGDRLRLEQALGNLVENALRYGAGTVLISARTAAGAIELHVQDEGPGLPAHFVPLAFHRFSRADESHAGSGAGLGLAIVDAIAVAHGGRAHVGARASDGGFDQTADIWISLPMTELVEAR